jgi:hypothetical protein
MCHSQFIFLPGGSMSNFQRREFLTGAAAIVAATTAALVGTRRADAGDPSFMNNVPDPLLSGKDLPIFKFALEKSHGKVIGKSTAREATVEQLPISKGIGTRPTCWRPTSASRRPCSRNSRAGTCSSWTRTGPRSPRRNGLEAATSEGGAPGRVMPAWTRHSLLFQAAALPDPSRLL